MVDINKLKQVEGDLSRLEEEWEKLQKRALEEAWKKYEKKILVAAKNEFGMSTTVEHEITPNYDWRGHSMYIMIKVDEDLSYGDDRRYDNEVIDVIKSSVYPCLEHHIVTSIRRREEE